MTRICTRSGRTVDVANLQQQDVDIEDIAHALAHCCRYNGHCSHFYSVAEHSVAVAAHCPPGLRLHGLLHDAAEAYLGDIVNPIKRAHPELVRYEEQLQHRILAAFGLRWEEGMPAAVHEADQRVMATEAPQLGLTLDCEPEPYGYRLLRLYPTAARSHFLAAFSLLTSAKLPPDEEQAELLMLGTTVESWPQGKKEAG